MGTVLPGSLPMSESTPPPTDGEEGAALLERLAREIAERQARGESPGPEEYVRQHPELADDVRALFDTSGASAATGAWPPYRPPVDRVVAAATAVPRVP